MTKDRREMNFGILYEKNSDNAKFISFRIFKIFQLWKGSIEHLQALNLVNRTEDVDPPNETIWSSTEWVCIVIRKNNTDFAKSLWRKNA